MAVKKRMKDFTLMEKIYLPVNSSRIGHNPSKYVQTKIYDGIP
jgi:hypothetical protein